MKMALGKIEVKRGKATLKPGDSHLTVVAADNVQFATIRSWNLMKWDKQNQMFYGPATMELLDKLATITPLPNGGISAKTGKPLPNIKAHRQKLHAIQDAVDRERVNQTPEPLYKYPVKMPLYAHQVRGANMCLLTFGWAQPRGTLWDAK